jgi:hypothetical protein
MILVALCKNSFPNDMQTDPDGAVRFLLPQEVDERACR